MIPPFPASIPKGGPVSVTDPLAGLGSVIIRCGVRLELIRRCIAALVGHTRPPWELIVLDDGMGVETAAYLAGLEDGSSVRVVVVPAPGGGDLGRILEAARGHYFVMVDVDAVVTDSWLDQLAALANSNPRIGMTGAMSNDAPPPQRVGEAAYTDPVGMREFAARWRDAHRGKWRIVDELSDPCRLVKRKVVEAVAGEGAYLDLFGDDLAFRVGRAGYTTAVACDLFIHRGPWPKVSATEVVLEMVTTRIASLSRVEFARRYGNPDTTRALCAYTGSHNHWNRNVR
jgi:O-antigen biosynthesis protein